MKMFSARFVSGLRKSALAALGLAWLFARGAGLPAAHGDSLSDSARLQIQALEAEKAARTPAQQKMDSQLVYALEMARTGMIAPGVTRLQIGVQPDATGRVRVDLDATVTPDLLNAITQSGGQVINSFAEFHAVRAVVPLALTETLAGRAEVKFIRPAVPYLTHTGSVDSEGDVTHRAAEARRTFGVDGTGVRVGVLSDSVDYLSLAQSTGDLPPNVAILPGQSGVGQGNGEGTAMLEIVYDLAPGAQLFFATALGGQAQFARNILDLRAAGCDIIVDDVGYFAESPFQDGVVAQAVNSVTAGGALYFSSAGNEGNLKHGTSGTWEGDFVDGGAVGTPVNAKGGNLHSFGATAYDNVTQQGSGVVLFWSDPLGASTNDYDLYVLDTTGANVVSSSTTVQNGAQDPFEIIVNPPSVGQRVVVVKATGDPRFLHLDTLRGQLAIGTDGNIRGHTATTNAYAVAAVDVHTAYPGPFTGGAANPVEFFSTDGPRRVFYNADGTAITPTNFLSTGGYVRPKPDITAADGVSTTVPPTPGPFDPFYGTSAAAPHAAAIAALIESYNPTLLPADLRTVLTNTALDIEAPGYDFNSGSGIVMAYQALQAAPALPLPRLTMQTNYVVGGNGNGLVDPNECNSFYLVLANVGFADATSVRATLSTPTPGVVILQPLSSYGNIPIGGSATNFSAYRVTTSPNFICGTPIDFTLVVKSDEATQTNQFQLATGTLAATVRFDNPTSYLIPDNDPNGVISPIFVSGITGSVAKVTVGLHLLHPSDGDLTLELIAPDGTTNLLAAHVGSGGRNFGLACAPDSALTFFDDAAATPIGSGFPPFVGSFIPQQALAVFNGKSGPALNGIWQLHVVDSIAQNAGSLACWSLLLTPVTCEDGGGQCPGVDLALGMTDNPDPAIIGSNLVYTLTVTNKGPNLAHGVVVTQNLPPSTVFVSATPSQGSASQSRGVVTATLGNLDAGASATISVVVLPTTAGTITSTANATSVDPELNPADNSATATTVVFGPVSDLAVSLADAPNPTIVGGPLTYTVTVTNNGPATATGVVLSNTLPASVLVNTVSSSQGAFFIAGNTVIANVGTLTKNNSATVTINVTPLAYGTIYATAVATANQPDPLLANNTVTVATSVGQAADVGLGIAAFPNPVVVGSNLTFVLTITNFGPNIATNVVVNDALPANVTVVSTTPSQGTVSQTGNNLIWNAGSLVVSGNATLTVVVQSANPGTLTTTATVTAGQSDPNPANNTATTTVAVAQPFVSIVPAGATLRSESFLPPDGSIDPGETVTLSFRLRNAGNVSNTNLTATLLATAGVTPAGATTQFYGLLAPSGLPGSRPFTFVAGGTNGGVLTVTLQLKDGTNSLPSVSFTFPLPQVTAFQNPTYITIPDVGAATPYPSPITVTGVTGTVGRVTATLNNLSHTFASDIDVLLVGPSGQDTILMSSAGNGFGVTNATLTFDDAAASPVPPADPLLSGSYQPAAYNSSPNFPAPALAGPYAAALSTFSGADPNGAWSLYVVDHSAGDAGHIDNGWSLAITTVTPINHVADLALTATAAPDPVKVGSPLTYSFVVTNAGPNAASGVAFTNVLPANVQLLSASASQGTVFTNGTTVSGSLGTLNPGATVTVTVLVTPTTPGVISNFAAVAASEVDLNLANNSASTLANAVLPVANVAVAGIAAPNPVVVGSNLTYTFTVANRGPETALNVVLTDPLPASVTFESASSQVGTVANLNGIVTCQLGNLAAGASANIVITVAPGSLAAITNTATVATFSNDPNPADNSAVVVTTPVSPAPHLAAAGARLVSESFSPPNGAVDPGETVTVWLSLANVGQLGTSNLVATLLATGGVTAPSGSQSYGVLAPGGPAAAQPFTFTASGVPGGTVTATLQLADGSNDLGAAQFVFSLPLGTTFANPTFISIPDHGAATPYPSTVVVSGLTGVVGKVTVTLDQVSHSFPDDINVLLVGPQGQNLLLVAGAGGGHPVTNLVLTFDDAATNSLPNSDELLSGTFKPTAYKTVTVFPRPAPAGPHGTSLAAFNGSDPNGTWSLYVFDDTVGDAGSIAGGWSLTLSAVQPVNGAADLSVSVTATPNPVLTGEPLTYTVNVFNRGPATATGVEVIDHLPADGWFVSAVLSQGSYALTTAGIACSLGSLPPGGQASLLITAVPAVPESATNTVTVGADQTDLNPGDNRALAVVTVFNPIPAVLGGKYDSSSRSFQLRMTGQSGQTYIFQVSTDLANWVNLSTNVASPAGVIQFTDTGATNSVSRFYRTIWLP